MGRTVTEHNVARNGDLYSRDKNQGIHVECLSQLLPHEISTMSAEDVGERPPKLKQIGVS